MTLGNAAGVLLGVVLLVAGASKLFDKQWAERERGLGSPSWALPFVAPVEIVLGALIAVRIARPVLAIAGMMLMMTFTVFLLIKWDERRGEPCNCFGVLSKRPASAWTIVRNLALIALALVAGFAR
jgi:uncharacterized membrane protein YphA (DoxX/SURF4 family)